MTVQAPSYPWYACVEDDSLEQGDFFFNCHVLSPVYPKQMSDSGVHSLQAVVNEHDVVILSQSCDLTASKLENVLVCPLMPLDVAEQAYSALRNPKDKEEVRRGHVPGLYMVAACEIDGFAAPVRIVSFRNVFSLPFSYIQSLAITTRPRLRLLPPYREHLAQAFGRFVMRVGLPIDIPPFNRKRLS